MAGATSRAKRAGIKLGEAIVEMVHLMYQNNTTKVFYKGLVPIILKEVRKRVTET